ncbi:transmembrane protein 70, mitochondrial [Antennarius striatus]|uniref:transmembrane protein 70, mitochondrial n=1 Tax=Antennarius striatus TaxID=241820 RepID=UPI0035B126CB
MIKTLTLFSNNSLPRLRPFIASLSVSNTHNVVVRCKASFTGAATRIQPTLDARRSLLNLNYKWTCPSIRCVSANHSENGNLIYTGNLGRAVRGVKLLSLSSSAISLVLMSKVVLLTDFESQALQIIFMGVASFFCFLIPIFLHLVTKGYIVRLYHNPDSDNYTAITYSLFLIEKKTMFHQSQVRIPPVSKMFTTFYGGRLGLLVNPDLFPLPHDYNHLMGYDKPFTFDQGSINRPDQQE